MHDDQATLKDGVDEARRLMTLAEAMGFPIRFFGGIAIYLQVPTWTVRRGKPRKDIDFVVRRRNTAHVTSMMEQAGYAPDLQQNTMYGHKQLYFVDEATGRPVDVIVDRLEMCHALDLADRLEVAGLTLPLADLVLSKLQIVKCDRKDLLDVIALLCEHPLTRDDSGISVPRITSLLSADWGWWRTTTGNLSACQSVLSSISPAELDFGRPPSFDPASQIRQLQEAIERAPKTMKWKLRAKVGDRAIWYEEPEEVIHLPARPAPRWTARSCAGMMPNMQTPLSPLDFARRTRRLHGAREAVVDGGLRLTYEQFFDRCDRWSACLAGLGVRQGDRVATIAPNTHAQLESFYAVPQLGAILVPVNYRLTPDDFVYIVNHSGSTVVCVHSDYLADVDAVRDQMPGVRHFVAFEGTRDGWLDYEAAIAAAEPRFTRPEISEFDLLTINYTSGTTARPKGVMITHRNAAMNTIGTLLHLPIAVGERYLWTLPMFHANGWTYTWTVTAAAGTHVCLRRVDPATVFRLIRDEHVALMCAAPTVLISLANASPETRGDVVPGVRVITAGAPPAAATIERLEGEFGWEVTHVYGLTETAPFITVCAPLPEHADLAPAERAVVKARQGVELLTSGELRVVDAEGNEVPADGQTLGEVTVRGNVVMEGYYNDPEATKRAMGDGWFHSGDAAVVHPDGYVEIRDRIKDVIISGGENISSVEVEGTLLRHPAVAEVAIVGVPSERWGETPHAFVVLRAGESATEPELIAFVRDRLAHFKAPHAVTFVDELPKTATGKIQKFVLRGGAAGISRQ